MLRSAELVELDPDGSRPLEGMQGLCGRRFDCFDPVCSAAVGVGAGILPSAGIEFLPREDAPCPPGALLWMLCVWPLRLRLFGVWGLWWVLGCKKWFREGGQLVSTRFEERSRFRRSVMWVLLLSGAACSCARDGASRTLLLVSVEVSEARSSMSTIDVDTVHSDERTISLAVIFVFIIYVRFIGIFYYPETPSDLFEYL